MRFPVLLVLVMAAAGCQPDTDHLLRVTGEIESVAVDAGSLTGGRVTEVLAGEGSRVAAGDVLLRLDAAEANARLAAARAALEQATAVLAKAEAGPTGDQLKQAEAAAEAAAQQYALAQEGARSQDLVAAAAARTGAAAQRQAAASELARLSELVKSGAVAQRQVEQAQAAYDAADAQWTAAREREGALVEGLRDQEVAAAKANADRAQAALDDIRAGTRTEDISAARAAQAAAQAQVQLAEVAVREATVVAPMDGIVQSLDVHPGDIVRPGPVVRLVDAANLELTVYVSAAMLGRVSPGQTLRFTTDEHGGTTFEGTVATVASEGEFTPRNLQTQEERVQQVFAVKLAVPQSNGLRPGMTATVQIPRESGGA